MPDAFARCHAWRDHEIVTELGLYPFFRPIGERLTPVESRIGGRTVLMAGSNDYLALSTDPRVKSAAADAAHRWGAGNSGSRLSNGTLELHEELEGRLAAFLGHEAALVTTTGYQANLSLSPLFGSDNTLLADRHVHASLLDATQMSRARLQRYRHNDTGDLIRTLDAADPDAGKLILTEGMFSATGELADLPGVAKAAEQYGARLVLDSAHDVGTVGSGGRGAAEHFGLHQAVDVQTLTFSKSFGTIGGAVAGPEKVICYLRHHARAMVFSASLPAPCAAAALTALDIIADEPERRRRVLACAERLSLELAALGFATAPTGTPTFAVHVGDRLLCLRLWTEVFDAGVFTHPMIAPGVPEGHDLIRVSMTAAHGDVHLERIVAAFAAAGRRLGMIT